MVKRIIKLISAAIFSISALTAQTNIKGETLNGDIVSVSELIKNGPVLINFWALWCQPCKAEMKHLKNIYEKYADKGFTILGVNQDSPKSLSKVNAYLSSSMIGYPVITDPNNEIFNSVNGQVMPYSLLLNKDGEVVYKHTGYLPGDEDKIEAEILKLLKESE
ncbi:MAG: TlpA family protein disulfide reductase [Ignavibacteriaceae bacterium]|nr:TlpA family protein disulfide reductase [Ignavibacteriaceae bacterium]